MPRAGTFTRAVTHTTTESGTTAILVAVALLLLMGFTSLAIDAGLGFDDRRGTQNAADLAALAAAWQHCNPASAVATPQVAAQQTATDNGYAHTPAIGQEVRVTPNTGVPANDLWHVEIVTRNQGSFGAATPYAPDQLDILSEATARCTKKGVADGFALFGKAPNCPGVGGDLDVSSANITVVGDVHGNGDVKITGSSPNVTGTVTYRERDLTSAGITTTQYYGSAVDYPISLAFSEFDPGSARSSPPATPATEYHNFDTTNITAASITARSLGTSSVGTVTITEPGIYRTRGRVDLKTVDVVLTGQALAKGVTFVSLGKQELKSLSDITGYAPLVAGGTFPILMFSEFGTYGCNDVAIKVSGNDVSWGGLIFAPKGGVNISTAAATTLNFDGSIIAYTLNLSGGTINIQYQDDNSVDPTFRVELVE